uniref:Nucleotide-diphospho-sugar transferase domain-containing protein n=2 Tax=Ditylum brightwellii TaxID=49249 RepID=A0A6S9A8V6_9STRA|mmetsp:Transcript_8539/g.12572  ORF Transcript_8539/g.12572 Transcript_8539/m.12572 type:complete len:441 (+) Transcript_8539:43-1365(+)
MSSTNDSTASSATTTSSNDNDGIPATSQQMDEMISLLRSLSKDGTDINAASAHAMLLQRQNQENDSGVGAVNAYSLPFAHRVSSLRHAVKGKKTFHILMILGCLIATTLFFGENMGASFHQSGSSFGAGGSGVMSSFSIPSTGTYGLKDKTLYYNTNGPSVDLTSGKLASPQPMSRIAYPDNGSVIATLCTNKDSDVANLRSALKSLAFLRGDQSTDPYSKLLKTPVLVFNEGDLNPAQIKSIVESTDRPVAFPLVDFQSFPNGFNPELEFAKSAPMFEVSGRSPWGYYQMIRFWVTMIWHHPALDRYEAVMRIDTDSCFLEPNEYLPHFMHDHLNYHSQYVGVEPEEGREYLIGLYDFAVEYMSRVKKTPGNVMLWHFIDTTWKAQKTLPLFRTNFEISRKSYMLRDDVVKWHAALTEEEVSYSPYYLALNYVFLCYCY